MFFTNFFNYIKFKGPFFKEGDLKMHSRYVRPNRDDMFKVMDKKKFKDLLKETTILTEEEFFKLADSKYSNFFFPKFDKAYFTFMFSLTITNTTTFFKERLSPSLSIYKGNYYSLISITLRLSGIFYLFIGVLYFFFGNYGFDLILRKIVYLLSSIYDEEALGNLVFVHGFVFVNYFVALLFFHFVYGFYHVFPISLRTDFISLLKSFLFIFFSIFCLNFLIISIITFFPATVYFLSYGPFLFIKDCTFYFFVNPFISFFI